MPCALMYHDVVQAGAENSSGFPGRDAARYKVTPERFAAHLRAVAHALRASHTPRPAASVILTFDDGGVSALRAAEALESHGFRGSFFVTANYVGTRGFVDGRDLRDLHERGHVIGSHSSSHPLRMGHSSWPQLLDEWTGSRHALADLLGADVTTASLPGGDFAPQVAEAAAHAGFTRLFTSEPSFGVRQAFGLGIQGRFTIHRWTTASTAAALASGEWLPCARQAVLWNAKTLPRRLGRARYLQVRRLLLRHGN